MIRPGDVVDARVNACRRVGQLHISRCRNSQVVVRHAWNPWMFQTLTVESGSSVTSDGTGRDGHGGRNMAEEQPCSETWPVDGRDDIWGM